VKVSSESILAATECPPGTLVNGAQPGEIAVVRGHAEIERRIAELPLESVFVRPTFIDHLLDGQRAAIEAGAVTLPAGDAELALVHPTDVAEVAVAALRAEWVPSEPLVLTGPEPLDLAAIVAMLSELSGHEVAYRPLTSEAWQAALLAAGMPADLAAGIRDGLELYVQRGAAPVHDGVERMLGRPPRSLRAYLGDEIFA
jgi:uncharacterized protein YbjT (DUF2867 family)